MSAYLLAFGGLLLLGGRAGDLLGRRRVFLAGTALFLASSLVCGLAWSGGVLIAARAVQGLSSALMAPTALAILMTTFEEGPERNRALAIWGGTGGLGATGALLLTAVSADGSYLGDLFGGLLVFGAGLGAATVAASIAALSGVPERSAGAATGLNTAAFQLGGAFGAAVMKSVVVAQTDGRGVAALTDGFQAGFATAALLAGLGALVALGALCRVFARPALP